MRRINRSKTRRDERRRKALDRLHIQRMATHARLEGIEDRGPLYVAVEDHLRFVDQEIRTLERKLA